MEAVVALCQGVQFALYAHLQHLLPHLHRTHGLMGSASPWMKSMGEVFTKEDSKEVYYKLTGTIDEIKNAQYGNINLKDANGDIVYVYGLLPSRDL